jgi:hypothetical protein
LAAQRYAGKVGAYEIWNEPNAAPYYGPQPDPAGYTELLKAAYPAIKAADPDATVIGGVVGSTVTYENYTLNPVTFVDEMYQSGAQGYFDALSFHPYQYTTPFSMGGYHPDSPINQLADIRDLMVANGDSGKLIWSSEYGEPTSVAGDDGQAAYLQDVLTTWRTLSYTGPAFVYTLEDDQTGSTNAEDTFGLIRSDGTWKPAAYVIQALASSPATTPVMARMALAMPEAAQAAPADLAALAAVGAPTDPAAASQVAGTILREANAVVTAAVPQSSPAAIPTRVVDRLRLADPDASPRYSRKGPALEATPTVGAPEDARKKQSADTPKKRSADAPKHSTDTADLSGAGQAGQTTRLPRRARDRMSQR